MPFFSVRQSLKAGMMIVCVIYSSLAGCSAKMRVIHLTPKADAADVYVNNTLVQADLEYRDVGCYTEVNPGLVDFQLVPTKRGYPAWIDCFLKVYSDQSVTVAAMGTTEGDMQSIMYDDDVETDLCKAKLRIIHASPDAPSLDILMTPMDRNGSSQEDRCNPTEPQYKNLCFKDASTYEIFEPGNYEFRANIALSNSSVLKIPSMTLCPGVNYTIFIIGLTRNNTLTSMTIIDSERD